MLYYGMLYYNMLKYSMLYYIIIHTYSLVHTYVIGYITYHAPAERARSRLLLRRTSRRRGSDAARIGGERGARFGGIRSASCFCSREQHNSNWCCVIVDRNSYHTAITHDELVLAITTQQIHLAGSVQTCPSSRRSVAPPAARDEGSSLVFHSCLVSSRRVSARTRTRRRLL